MPDVAKPHAWRGREGLGLTPVDADRPRKALLLKRLGHERVAPNLLEHVVKRDAARRGFGKHGSGVLANGIEVEQVGVGLNHAARVPVERKLGEGRVGGKQAV